MTDYKELSDKIRRVAWGYIFILFDINIATVSILPNWAGYLMIVAALPVLAMSASSAKLLKPLGIALAVYSVADWAMKIFSVSYSLTAVSIVVLCIRIYFNFQLFTNLAEIAENYSCTQRKSLLNLRTAITVTDVFTNLVLFVVRISVDNDDFTYIIPIVMAIIQLIIMICICAAIFSLAKSLETYSAEPDISADQKTDFSAETPENSDGLTVEEKKEE